MLLALKVLIHMRDDTGDAAGGAAAAVAMGHTRSVADNSWRRVTAVESANIGGHTPRTDPSALADTHTCVRTHTC